MLEQEEDWTVLPPEVIQLIAKKLADLIDFIHFRATCKTWRSSAPLSDPPPQLPWFLELLPERYDHTYGPPGIEQRFYSVSSCQTLTIRLTLDQSQRLWYLMQRGVFSHYLAFADSHDEIMCFLNPLTKDQFLLPSPSIGPDISFMVWTGTDPIRNRRIILAEMFRWACYDPHSNKWVEQEGCYDNNCYWQGMFFSTYVARATEVFDVSSKKLLHKIPPLMDEVSKNNCDWFDQDNLGQKSYLVESLGTILRVSWLYDILDMDYCMFNIYKLDFDGLDGQPCWVRVDNIGNQVLFLVENTCFSMTARPSTGFREGCVYFIDPYDDTPYVYDIWSGRAERVPCPFERCTWFLPNLC